MDPSEEHALVLHMRTVLAKADEAGLLVALTPDRLEDLFKDAVIEFFLKKEVAACPPK